MSENENGKLSFSQFIAKAETVDSNELMEMITGGVEESCHPGRPGCRPPDCHLPWWER
jgi:hypothetical protein